MRKYVKICSITVDSEREERMLEEAVEGNPSLALCKYEDWFSGGKGFYLMLLDGVEEC